MKKQTSFLLVFSLFTLVFVACKKDDDKPEPKVISAAGDISAAIAEYRALADAVGGRQEINWDGVPDENAAPYFLPSDFFNASEGNRARGAVLTTNGSGVQASADSDNPAGTLPQFGNINPNYNGLLPPFSGERVFSPVGSNVAELTFYVPGTNTPGVVHGFGAVYVDVDRNENTAFEYFDIDGKSLGSFPVPAQDGGHSFLAVHFPTPIVHRVRIEYGSGPLGPDESATVDVAVMDDFIYDAPQAEK
ncbi:MAG: hypothetical protein IPN76_21740 [Saprospiraceae bacterium]|nr:hypothetical protein [Saprospiraceae bacterium]